MEIVTLKNSKIVVELINPEPELANKIEIMLGYGGSRDYIEHELRKHLCYFEWKIKHIFGGVL